MGACGGEQWASLKQTGLEESLQLDQKAQQLHRSVGHSLAVPLAVLLPRTFLLLLVHLSWLVATQVPLDRDRCDISATHPVPTLSKRPQDSSPSGPQEEVRVLARSSGTGECTLLGAGVFKPSLAEHLDPRETPRTHKNQRLTNQCQHLCHYPGMAPLMYVSSVRRNTLPLLPNVKFISKNVINMLRPYQMLHS